MISVITRLRCSVRVVNLPSKSLTHSLTAARNRLWVVATSMLTGRRRVPMRLQQWVRCPARSDLVQISGWKMAKFDPQPTLNPLIDRHKVWNTWLCREQKIVLNPPRGFCPYIREMHTRDLRIFASLLTRATLC